MNSRARISAVLVVMLVSMSSHLAFPGHATEAQADRFDYPVGYGDCTTYPLSDYRVEPGADFLDPSYHQAFGAWHTGEDWNRGSGNTDLGDPVCAIANGVVTASAPYGSGWGNIILIKHTLPGGVLRWSQYAHLNTRLVATGESVTRGQEIGTIGRGYNNEYLAHLHFEIRKEDVPANNWPNNKTTIESQYVDPSDRPTDSHSAVGFIESNRVLCSPLGLSLLSGTRAEFNKAGTDDFAVFTARSGGGTQIDAFYGRTDARAFQGLTNRWSSTSYDPASIVGTVAGDFNADGRSDVAAFVTEGGSTSRLDVFVAQADNTFAAPATWWRGTSFTASAVGHVLPGDFDGDGDTDVLITHWQPSTTTYRIWQFFSARGQGYFRPKLGKEFTGGYSGSRVLHAASGDFNADCVSDLATFYDYGNDETRIHMFLGQPTEELAYQGSAGWWMGTAYALPRVAHVTGGDFDNDGDSDIAAMFHYENSSRTRLHVFRSSGSAFGAKLWLEIPDGSGFFPPRVVSLVPGDFDSNLSKDTDLIGVYRNPDDSFSFYGFRAKSDLTFTDREVFTMDLTGYVADVRHAAPTGTRQATGSESDVSVTKTDSPGRVPVGRNLTYIVTAANDGPDAAPDVVVTDNLPPSVDFVSAAPDQGSCTESAGMVRCDLGTVQAGTTATVEIVVTPKSAELITNVVSATASAYDPVPGDNTDSEDTTVCRVTSRRSSIPCG